MKYLNRITTAILLAMTFNITMAQDNTLRLIYPQWQGGDIAKWITEVKDPEQAQNRIFKGKQKKIKESKNS